MSMSQTKNSTSAGPRVNLSSGAQRTETNHVMYAKDYFGTTRIIADPGLCFVLMPFAPKFDKVWTQVRKTVTGPPFNLLCRRADDIASPGHILTDVFQNIGRARLLIADLTDQNPNVFYELGVAHSVKHSSQVILMASDKSSVPFDLQHLRCLYYEGDLLKLRRLLASALRELEVQQYSLSLEERKSGRMPRLTGNDSCLYEPVITVDHIGDDGVKFRLKLVRYTAGKEPVQILDKGQYLGKSQPAMKIPKIPWSLCYHKLNRTQVQFIVGRPPGWQPLNGP